MSSNLRTKGKFLVDDPLYVHNTVNKKLGKKTREIRKDKNLSQLDIAAICNIDDKHISRIEPGQVDVRLSTILKIAKALEIGPEEFFSFE